MFTIETATTFFGWMIVINFTLLLLSSIGVIGMRTTIARIHGRMFGLQAADLSRAYFLYLAQYKIAIIVFCLAPYLALRIMLSG